MLDHGVCTVCFLLHFIDLQLGDKIEDSVSRKGNRDVLDGKKSRMTNSRDTVIAISVITKCLIDHGFSFYLGTIIPNCGTYF